MFRFLRNIRKGQLKEDKKGNYLAYAIGEVVLVVIGILIALQVNNWNEDRLLDAQFNTSVEQLYNTIHDDIWQFESRTSNTEALIGQLDFVLQHKDTMSNYELLPGFLWSFSLLDYSTFNSESPELVDRLEFNSNNQEHRNLVNQLRGYVELIKEKTTPLEYWESQIPGKLIENNIPIPGFDIENVQRGFVTDSTFYSRKEALSAKRLLQDDHFISLLKSQRSQFSRMHLDSKVLLNDARAMVTLVKKFNPDVKLLFQDVGIIGTSINGFDDVGAKSTPMNLIDESNNIWQITFYLKEGRVKFRCRDSWAINWGGSTFPSGKALREGQDIIVDTPGNYQVTLNLNEYTYEFRKLE